MVIYNSRSWRNEQRKWELKTRYKNEQFAQRQTNSAIVWWRTKYILALLVSRILLSWIFGKVRRCCNRWQLESDQQAVFFALPRTRILKNTGCKYFYEIINEINLFSDSFSITAAVWWRCTCHNKDVSIAVRSTLYIYTGLGLIPSKRGCGQFKSYESSSFIHIFMCCSIQVVLFTGLYECIIGRAHS